MTATIDKPAEARDDVAELREWQRLAAAAKSAPIDPAQDPVLMGDKARRKAPAIPPPGPANRPVVLPGEARAVAALVAAVGEEGAARLLRPEALAGAAWALWRDLESIVVGMEAETRGTGPCATETPGDRP